MKIVRLHFQCKIKTYICKSLSQKRQHARQHAFRRFLSAERQRERAQSNWYSTQDGHYKTSNNCSHYLPLSSTWMSLQNKIHLHCQSLVYELLESYFRHIYRVGWFHRIRKCYFSRTSKAESWEQVQAPEQLPLTNSVMHTQLHIALHVCCTQQGKSVKQILFPVPRC